MDGCLRIDVSKSDAVIILVDDLRRDFSVSDLLEDVHASVILAQFRPQGKWVSPTVTVGLTETFSVRCSWRQSSMSEFLPREP